MSEIEKEDSRREYLPLVNASGQDNTRDPTGMDPKVNNGSMLSGSHNKDIYGVETLDQRTFYQKNKKVINIALISLLVVGIILAIVLPLTLGGGNGPSPPSPPIPPVPPRPPPIEPDPYMYQEFNPFYIDQTAPIKTTTYDATFQLAFNSSALNGQAVRTKRKLPAAVKAFMRDEEEQVGDDLVYRPMNPRFLPNNENNTWTQKLSLSVQMNNNNQARVLLTDSQVSVNQSIKHQVNSNLFPRPKLEIESRLKQVGFTYNETASFAFNFTDIYSQETLVTTLYRKMVVTDFYSEIGFVLPTQRCFGLGTRNGRFQLDSGTYSFNTRSHDQSLAPDDGYGGKSSNHIQPFMLCQSAVKRDFFGMFFASTAPQVFEVVKFTNSSRMVLNYITIGGALEFYVFMRGTAQEIIQQYHGLIGNPMMPPYYALGIFHGSNTYDQWSKVKAVYDNYNGAAGPKQALDAVFVEEFNMASHWSLTVNSQTFPNLGAEVDKIHGGNQRIVFGASLALAVDTNYPWYVQAKQGQCLVKSFAGLTSGPLTGILGQTQVQYLDTYSQCFDTWLSTSLPAFTASTHGFDGLLVKDSHAPNHINGQLVTKSLKKRQLLGDDNVTNPINEETVGNYSPYQINNGTQHTELSTYYLPFVPAWAYSGYLDNMSISLNATVGDDLGGGRYSTLQAKNGMAGYALKRAANAYAGVKNSSRPLLFSDASWAGSGQYSAALITDQYRSWLEIESVIPQAVALSMYGHSATMVDTCGSLGPMDEDLCARWTQLATFMPMVRNYFNATYKDPVTGTRNITDSSEPWLAKSSELNLAYAALGDRLRFSRYMYTQLYLAHTQGGSFVRPLFFHFPKDDQTFQDWVQISTYMLGSALKVSPSIYSGQASYLAYFPQGIWVNVYNASEVITAPAGGLNATLTVNAAQTNVHQRGGSIIPYLNNNLGLRTTRDVENQLRTGFRVVRDEQGYAEGDFMIDDGETPNLYSPAYMDTWDYETYDKNFTHYGLRMSSEKTINFMVQHGDSAYQPPAGRQSNYLDQIDIMNAADLANTTFVCALNRSWIPINLTYSFNSYTNVLTLKPVGIDVTFDQVMLIKFGEEGKDISFCNGFTYTAEQVDEDRAETYLRYNLTSNQAPGVVEDLVAEFLLIDDDGSILVEITTQSDYQSDRSKLYRPPQPEFWNISNYYNPNKLPKQKLHTFLQVNTEVFQYSITNYSGAVIYSSDPIRQLVTDHFIIESGHFAPNPVNGKPFMGLGERAGRAQLKNQNDSVHTLWPQDAPNPIDDGKAPGKNMYGYQPVYYFQSETADWMAVFDISTYAADYFINTMSPVTRVTRVAVGGLVYKAFLQSNKSIEAVILKYQKLTGYQTVAPMWAFGWNQCKFGYVNDSVWWQVYNDYQKYNIPLDTMWADIDYMDDYKVFTISPESYPNLANHVTQIQKDGRHFVPIIDDAIAVRPGQGYQPYETGLQQDVFIKKADLSGPATGGVWPGHAYFPDFFKPETVTWWKQNLQSFNNMIQFDGIWLDMNEASSTCTGYCYQDERPANSIKYKLPYLPGQRDLEIQALGLDTVHTTLTTPLGGYRTEYDVRSLYAIKESQATHSYLSAGGKRPFVLSRSNAPGLQKYAFHWLADNWSKVEWMKTSIDSLYEYNLFGLPMMGSDICGFNLDATPELCTRWHQLGAFYPFSRNHKNSVWKQTEPYQYNFPVPELGDGTTYTDLIRTALLHRYSLLRYIYSSFHHIGKEGGSFFKPLYYEFQNDNTTFDDDATERNILLGSALKLSIQVQDLDQVSTEYQFPTGRWCQVIPKIDPAKCYDTSAGDPTTQRLDSGIADYQVHIRGGRMMPYQNASMLNVSKSADLVAAPTQLIGLPNDNNGPIYVAPFTYNAMAAGLIYLDDGTSVSDIGRVDYYVQYQGHGQYFITFVPVANLTDTKVAGKAAVVSSITLLWASEAGSGSIKSAKLVERTGAEVDLYAPFYDLATDTLTVEVANSQPGKTWTFFEIDKIILQTN